MFPLTYAYMLLFSYGAEKIWWKEGQSPFYFFNSIIKGSTRLLAVVTRVFVAEVPHRDTHTLVLTTYMEKEKREKGKQKGER